MPFGWGLTQTCSGTYHPRLLILFAGGPPSINRQYCLYYIMCGVYDNENTHGSHQWRRQDLLRGGAKMEIM